MKHKHIKESIELAQRSLNSLSQVAQGSQELKEAFNHMKLAISKLEHQQKKSHQRVEQSDTLAKQWWGTIVSNVAKSENASHSNVAQQTAMRTLKQLNAMMSEEMKKQNALEASILQNIQAKTGVPNKPSVDGTLLG